jgi:hypothetical protein
MAVNRLIAHASQKDPDQPFDPFQSGHSNNPGAKDCGEFNKRGGGPHHSDH